jgi:subtilisin family serine protease
MSREAHSKSWLRRAKPKLLAAAASVLVACGGGGGGEVGGPAPNPWMDPNNIVVYKPDDRSWPEVLSSLGFTGSVEQIDQLGGRPIYLLQPGAGIVASDLIAALNKQGTGYVAGPNALVRAPEYLDNAFPFDAIRNSVIAIGGMELVSGPEGSAWAAERLRIAELDSAQSVVTVAVLDTGIAREHSMFAGRLLLGHDFVDRDADPMETACPGEPTLGNACGHGTHVAGLVVQTAAAARIRPVRVLDGSGTGTLWTLAQGLIEALDPDGSGNYDNAARVINLSLGVKEDHEVLAMLVDIATCAKSLTAESGGPYAHPGFKFDRKRCASVGGAVLVAGAGNDPTSPPLFPAAYSKPGLIAVTASNREDGLAWFSSRGVAGEVAAPGDSIAGPYTGNKGYALMRGTSMAAPWVAGTAALLLAGRPAVPLLNSEIVDRIRSTARPMSGSPAGLEVDPVAALAGVPARGRR